MSKTKETKAQLLKRIENLERQVEKKDKYNVEFTQMAIDRSRKQDKELAREKRRTKKKVHKLVNVHDLAMVLKEIPGDPARNRVLNTILRLSSGR